RHAVSAGPGRPRAPGPRLGPAHRRGRTRAVVPLPRILDSYCSRAAATVQDPTGGLGYPQPTRRSLPMPSCQARLPACGAGRGRWTICRTDRERALVLETIGYVRLGAEAVSEIDFVKLCRAYGLPQPDLQRTRTDASGRVRYLDAFWEEFRLHAEVDGGYHLDAESYWADMERQNGLWIDGELILRFAAWAVRHEPERVASQLRRALLQRGWRP